MFKQILILSMLISTFSYSKNTIDYCGKLKERINDLSYKEKQLLKSAKVILFNDKTKKYRVFISKRIVRRCKDRILISNLLEHKLNETPLYKENSKYLCHTQC